MLHNSAQVVEVAKQYKILIIEDDRDFSLSLQELLESRDYLIDAAFNVEDAQHKITNGSAHVVLLDIRLGRSDGMNIINTMKKFDSQTIWVVMTAYATIDTAIQALQ